MDKRSKNAVADIWALAVTCARVDRNDRAAGGILYGLSLAAALSRRGPEWWAAQAVPLAEMFRLGFRLAPDPMTEEDISRSIDEFIATLPVEQVAKGVADGSEGTATDEV